MSLLEVGVRTRLLFRVRMGSRCRKRETWGKEGDGLSRIGRVKTTISRGSKTDEEIIQLRALGASSRDGVLKSVELRVDYESR